MIRRARHAIRVLGTSDTALADARKEVETKGDGEIDRETAIKWATRAVAAFDLATDPKRSLKERVEFFSMGDDFRHEAREHAGTAADNVETLHRVERKVDPARAKALASFGDSDA